MLETVRTFTALSEEFVEEGLRLWPVRATAAGIHDYDHLLPDDTPDGFRARGAWLRDLEQRLAASVPWEELPTEQRVDYALLRSRLAVQRAELEEIRTHARDPVGCLRTALDGVLLLMRPFAPLEERKGAIVARLMAIPEYLAAARAGLEQAPRIWVDLALEVADGGPALVSDVVRVLLRAFPHEAERIEHAGVRANSGLAAFREALERELGPRAGGSFALGARWLDFHLEREHLLPLGNEALEQLGREQVALAHRGLEELGRLDPGCPWRARVEEARQRRSGAGWSPEGAEAEVARAHRFVLERRLAPLSGVRLGIAAAPPYRRPLFARAAYLPPAPFDVEPQGMLLVPASESARRPGSRERAVAGCDLALVAAREGWPGRHLQSAHAIHCGSRLRRIAGNRLLAGGWALYAEELMVEEGFMADAGARLGWLIDLLDSATRAVAGVALHTGRMSPAQTADYLIEEALLDRPAALAEVKRLTLDPARGLGGLVGRLQILELREEAKRRLGAKYNRLDFHAALLAGGTIPPALLREELWERLGVN
jgi:uncharacterized protein (DUF885 family)